MFKNAHEIAAYKTCTLNIFIIHNLLFTIYSQTIVFHYIIVFYLIHKTDFSQIVVNHKLCFTIIILIFIITYLTNSRKLANASKVSAVDAAINIFPHKDNLWRECYKLCQHIQMTSPANGGIAMLIIPARRNTPVQAPPPPPPLGHHQHHHSLIVMS